MAPLGPDTRAWRIPGAPPPPESLYGRHGALWLGLIVALFPVLSLTLPHGHVGAALLILAATLLLPGHGAAQAAAGDLRWLSLFAVASVAAVAAAIAATGVAWQGLDYPARFLLLPLFAWRLARHPLDPRPFWLGCALGAVGAACLAGMQFGLGLTRPGGYQNPIMFGNVALVLAACCAIGLLGVRRRPAAALILALGLFSGLAANVMAQSRGGWLALLLTTPVLLAVMWRGLAGRARAVVVAGVIATSVLLSAAIGVLDGGQRFTATLGNASGYLHGDAPGGTSEAERLEMWKHALALWRQAPLFGVGPGNLDEAYAARAQAGLMDPHSSRYKHAHNQYLDALASGGLVGLAGLLAILIGPLALLARRYRQTTGEARAYALTGMALVLLYLGFNLTQAMFAHNLGILFYVVMLAICWRGAAPDHETALHHDH